MTPDGNATHIQGLKHSDTQHSSQSYSSMAEPCSKTKPAAGSAALDAAVDVHGAEVRRVHSSSPSRSSSLLPCCFFIRR